MEPAEVFLLWVDPKIPSFWSALGLRLPFIVSRKRCLVVKVHTIVAVTRLRSVGLSLLGLLLLTLLEHSTVRRTVGTLVSSLSVLAVRRVCDTLVVLLAILGEEVSLV